MTTFNIIWTSITFILIIFCFWLPYKSGKKITGIVTGVVLFLIMLWLLSGQLEFLVIFIWPTIIAFQLVFLGYWIFRFFNKKKTGIIFSSILGLSFFLIALSPWISDWMFNRKDARKMLSWHNIELKDNFKILRNESGGFTDYAHTFSLKISEDDFNIIVNEIRNSKKFKGLITDFENQLPNSYYRENDTIEYETEKLVHREYYTDQKMEDGTYHFILQLDKELMELNYTGINE